jgi:hypothetical protein
VLYRPASGITVLDCSHKAPVQFPNANDCAPEEKLNHKAAQGAARRIQDYADYALTTSTTRQT